MLSHDHEALRLSCAVVMALGIHLALLKVPIERPLPVARPATPLSRSISLSLGSMSRDIHTETRDSMPAAHATHAVAMAKEVKVVDPADAVRPGSHPIEPRHDSPAKVPLLPSKQEAVVQATVATPHRTAPLPVDVSTLRQPSGAEGVAAAAASPERIGSGQEASLSAITGEDIDPGAGQLRRATPLYRLNPLPVYPRLARRRGHQGTVVLQVLVDQQGRVADLQLFESSGYQSLDRAAMRAVHGWRFEPGQQNGQPMVTRVRVPVRFELQ